MRNISWGEFPNTKFTGGLNAGITTSAAANALTAIVFGCIGLWFEVVAENRAMLVLFAFFGAMFLVVFLSNSFGKKFRTRGMKVVKGGVDICFSFRVSFRQGDTSETRFVPWSNIESANAHEGGGESADGVVVHFKSPLLYPRGAIAYFGLEGFRDFSEATWFSAKIQDAMSAATNTLAS